MYVAFSSWGADGGFRVPDLAPQEPVMLCVWASAVIGDSENRGLRLTLP